MPSFPCPREWLFEPASWCPTTVGTAVMPHGTEEGRVNVVYFDSRRRPSHRPDFVSPVVAGRDDPFYELAEGIKLGTTGAHGSLLSYDDGEPPVRVGVLAKGHTKFVADDGSPVPMSEARAERSRMNNSPDSQVAYGRLIDVNKVDESGVPYRLSVFVGALKPGITPDEVAEAAISPNSGEWAPDVDGNMQHWGPNLVSRPAVTGHPKDSSFALAAGFDSDCTDCADGWVTVVLANGATVCMPGSRGKMEVPITAALHDGMDDASNTNDQVSRAIGEIELLAELSAIRSSFDSLQLSVDTALEGFAARIATIETSMEDERSGRLSNMELVSNEEILQKVDDLEASVETIKTDKEQEAVANADKSSL